MRTVELAKVATEINVSPQQVWAVLTDFPRYPEWSTYIQEIDGRADAGTNLRIVMRLPGQRPIVARLPLIEATPGVRLAWAAVIPGAAWLPKAIFGGVHEFILTALPDGGTRFLHREHLSDRSSHRVDVDIGALSQTEVCRKVYSSTDRRESTRALGDVHTGL